MKVLFSWIGFKDLTCIEKKLKDSQFLKAIQCAKKGRKDIYEAPKFSPLDQIIQHIGVGGLERIVVFFDLDSDEIYDSLKIYLENLCKNIEIIRIESNDVYTYGSVWKTAFDKWKEVAKKVGYGTEPCFNLSSGTAAMNAFLITLGQGFFWDRAKFFKVSDTDGRVMDCTDRFSLEKYAMDVALMKAEEVSFSSVIIGKSPQMQEALRRTRKAAETDCNVLIYGETGTGKELFAREIFQRSNRASKKFTVINCATLGNLADSTLFGHVKGAFTGADRARQGEFELTNEGTLFLDEVEACPIETQGKLLRALQPPLGEKITCRRFQKVGQDEKVLESDVRIIAATNELLNKTGSFRTDLLNRLATLTITLPALRERPEDIVLTAETLFEEIKAQLGDSFKNKKLSDSAIKFIESRAWLGNVRELKNALTEAIVFCDDDEITDKDFNPNLPSIESVGYPAAAAGASGTQEEIDISQKIDLEYLAKKKDLEFKMKYIRAAKKRCKTKEAAAGLLGISYQTMGNVEKRWNKLQEKTNKKAETSEK